MSINYFPTGWDRVFGGENLTTIRFGDVFEEQINVEICGYVNVPGQPPEPIICENPGPDQTADISVDVASYAVAALPDVDYYLIGIRFDPARKSEFQGGRYCQDGGLFRCFAGSDTVYTTNDFRWLDAGEETEGDLSAAYGTEVPNFPSGYPGSLLNPSPSYPVPDTDGNNLGKLLFTAAELPAAIGSLFRLKMGSYTPGGEDGQIKLGITVVGYYTNGTVYSSSGNLMCVL